MKKIITLMAIICIALCANAQKCTTIKYTRSDDGSNNHMFVSMKVGDVAFPKMLFDTGASISKLTKSDYKLLKKRGLIDENGAGYCQVESAIGAMSENLKIYKLKDVVIGNVMVHDVEVVFMDTICRVFGQNIMEKFYGFSVNMKTKEIKFYYQ